VSPTFGHIPSVVSAVGNAIASLPGGSSAASSAVSTLDAPSSSLADDVARLSGSTRGRCVALAAIGASDAHCEGALATGRPTVGPGAALASPSHTNTLTHTVLPIALIAFVLALVALGVRAQLRGAGRDE
jgi:hypothetical protein